MRILLTILVTFVTTLVLIYGGMNWILRSTPTTITQSEDASPQKQDIKAGRALLVQENPLILARIAKGGAFGGAWSRKAAAAMLSRDPEISEDIRGKTSVEKIADHIWLIRMPIVNVAVVETENSLVLIDSGYAASGPVIREILPQLSDKPLSHIFISHNHIDHAFGAWAFMSEDNRPKIIGHEKLEALLRHQITYGGTIAHYTNQPAALQPQAEDELALPDETFTREARYIIGGVEFQLFAARGETEDQFYVWLPEDKALFVADYYQGFLPNAGNGKRMQRHIGEWADAMRHMASLGAQHMVPMHGAAVSGAEEISRVLTLNADAFTYIQDYVRDGLNQAKRQDRIVTEFVWPERFANASELSTPYVRPHDIVKMEMRRHTGWWNDIPSDYFGRSFEHEALAVIEIAGGIDALIQSGREHREKGDVVMAARIADWAVYGAPSHYAAHKFAVETYLERILATDTPTMELLVYLDAAAWSRAQMEKLTNSANE